MKLFSAFLAILVLFHLPEIKAAARPQNRVINGYPCGIDNAPHVVQLNMKYDTIAKTGFCGGSLVSNKHVLTAAHCLDGYVFSDLTLKDILDLIILGLLNPGILLDPNYGDLLEIQLVAGSDTLVTDLENTDSTSCKRTAFRQHFRIHEDYNSETLVNDIGMIELPNPFTLTDCPDAKCILLPILDEAFDVYTELTVAGFGLTSDDGSVSRNLMCGEMQIVSDDVCTEVYGETYNLAETMYCVEAVDDDHFCNGDSGSAMFTIRGNIPIEVCIVSFGHIDSCENYPQGCTQVSPYILWICQDPDFMLCPNQVIDCLTD